ncbi:MAG: MlaD family protein [Pseudomonadota bacterium]
MNDQPPVASPEVSQSSGFSMVWLIPIVTLAVGGWLIVKTLTEQGPTATVSFRTAAGIEVGKTRVKYKSVDIGMVEDVQFADDFGNIIANLRLNKGLDDFLRRNTRFWVVRPQLSVRGASGLETLLSGAYIEIDPGPGSRQRHFVGLERQPLISAEDEGSRITLISDALGSVDTGSPIYYQGLLAGEVLGYDLASDAQSVYVHAFVRDPYNQLIRGNTRFWNVSGLDISLGADGLEVRTASVQSLLFGGIAFETPNTTEPVPENISDLVFTLYPDFQAIAEGAYARRLRYVLYFDSSVRGLNAGAPVELKGIRVGSVHDVRLEFNADDTSFLIPVIIELEPDRIVGQQNLEQAPENILSTLVERGLRARLQTGSLLTGQLFVELNMYDEAPLDLRGDGKQPYPELPTIAGSFEAITATVDRFIAQLDSIDLEAMAENLNGILAGANSLINTDIGGDVATDLQASIRSLRNVLKDLDAGNLDQTLSAANTALVQLDEALKLTSDVLTPSSPLQYNLTQLTAELEETARSIRNLMDLLQRQPSSLLFGKDNDSESDP